MALPGMAAGANGDDHGTLGTAGTLWWIGCELEGRRKVEGEDSQGALSRGGAP